MKSVNNNSDKMAIIKDAHKDIQATTVANVKDLARTIRAAEDLTIHIDGIHAKYDSLKIDMQSESHEFESRKQFILDELVNLESTVSDIKRDRDEIRKSLSSIEIDYNWRKHPQHVIGATLISLGDITVNAKALSVLGDSMLLTLPAAVAIGLGMPFLAYYVARKVNSAPTPEAREAELSYKVPYVIAALLVLAIFRVLRMYHGNFSEILTWSGAGQVTLFTAFNAVFFAFSYLYGLEFPTKRQILEHKKEVALRRQELSLTKLFNQKCESIKELTNKLLSLEIELKDATNGNERRHSYIEILKTETVLAFKREVQIHSKGKLLVVLFTFLLLTGCINKKEQVKEIPNLDAIVVLADVTDTFLSRPDSSILERFGIISDNMRGASFRISAISDKSLNRAYSCNVSPSSLFTSNELAREDSVRYFKEQVIRGISRITALPIGRAQSSIYPEIVTAANELAAKDGEVKNLLIFSDCFINSNMFSVYRPSDLQLLRTDPKEVLKQFEIKYPLNNLSTVDVFILFDPKNATESEQFDFLMNQLIEPLFKRAGARSIKRQANL